jgi:hypothetical protein
VDRAAAATPLPNGAAGRAEGGEASARAGPFSSGVAATHRRDCGSALESVMRGVLVFVPLVLVVIVSSTFSRAQSGRHSEVPDCGH